MLQWKAYSQASDVYAFGMLLVEMFTQQPPFFQDKFKALRQITALDEVYIVSKSICFYFMSFILTSAANIDVY